MLSKIRLGVSDAMYLRPLLVGLNSADSPFEPAFNFPAVNSIHLNERTDDLRCAFLSPIDYARYGGSYRVVPQVCVSSSKPTGTITLTVKRSIRNIRTVAVDIRVTSEIILAKIIMLERLRNLPEDRDKIEFLPMMPDLQSMLQKADAALIVNLSPLKSPSAEHSTIDLVEEWSEMTGFPYVHGFWVGREEDMEEHHVKALIAAKNRGVEKIGDVIEDCSLQSPFSHDDLKNYFESFSYDFDEGEIESVSEFITFAYYHGVLNDVPEISFFESSANG